MKDSNKKTFSLFRRQITLIRKENQLIGEREEAFPFWFCQAMLADPDDTDKIRKSLVGGKNDRNIDIIYISEKAKIVHICQTKYREKLMGINEKVNDVTSLAHIASSFSKSKAEFDEQFSNSNIDVKYSMARAWELVRYERYSIRPIFVTTGKISKAFIAEAQSIVNKVKLPGGRQLDIEYNAINGKDCCRLYVDYEDLVPSVPYVEFKNLPVTVKIESATENLYSHIFSVRTNQIADIFRIHGERLFARNIRLSKGTKSVVNKEILKSLKKYPEEFFYLNNGITVLGYKAEKIDDKIRVELPQIINGQQTTRMIASAANTCRSASVLVKVIVRSANNDREVDEFRKFVRRIVRATNFQNAIKLSELAANNTEHIELERAFKFRQWEYIRKKGIREAHDNYWVGAKKPFGKISLQELTTALVACIHDPQYIRTEGIEKIYEEIFEENTVRIYDKLFPSMGRDIDEYLFCILCYYLAGWHDSKPNTVKRSIENHGRYYITSQLYRALYKMFNNSKYRKNILIKMGVENYQHKYVDKPEICEIRKAIGRSWYIFYKKKGKNDIRSFVQNTADLKTWNRYYDGSKSNAKNRNSVRGAIAKIEKQLKDEYRDG